MKHIALPLFFALTLPLAVAADARVPVAANIPQTLVADPQVRLTFGDERLVLAGGLQPSMLYTRRPTAHRGPSPPPHPRAAQR